MVKEVGLLRTCATQAENVGEGLAMMTASVRKFSWLMYLLIAGLLTPPALGQQASSGTKAPAKLIASVSGVAPGETFEVAIAYDVAEDWHIYWKNPGDSGAPPRVKWDLPDGFTVSDLRFPAPSRHVVGPEDFKIVTYVLEGKPALLAEITAPEGLNKGPEVELAAEVVTLVCKEACLNEKQTVRLRLPVVADASKVESANAETFKDFEKRIPASGKGKFVTVSADASQAEVEVGQGFELTVTVDVRSGFHIQSNTPTASYFIPTEVLVAPVPGVQLGDLKYPPAKERVDKVLRMKLSEYAGKAEVTVPIEKVTSEASGDELTLEGIVIAQACSDKSGQCYPPEAVSWSTTVALAGAIAEDRSAGAASATGEPTDDDLADDDKSAVAGADDSKKTADAASADAEDEVQTAAAVAGESDLSLPAILALAFLGGLILNVMPCVLPVISIKVLSFVQQASEEPARVFRLGIVFALGIVVSFWALAAFVVATKAAAGSVSWGEQFARPEFVIAMTAIVFAFGLSLFGVFEVMLPGTTASKLGQATTREGYPGAFLKGTLATLLATPCTAPLLAPAIATAFTQSSAVIVAALTAVGFGMAFPYILLTAKPGWMKYLPKPGPWMDSFKQFMGFVLMATVVWLLWVLKDLMGATGVVATVAFLVGLSLACWVIGRIKLTWDLVSKLTAGATALGIVVASGWLGYGWLYVPPSATAVAGVPASDTGLPPLPTSQDWEDGIPWVHHRRGLHEELSAAGYTVYVDYTATWCLTCQANKKVVLETDDVRRRMAELGVIPIKADFTAKPDWMAKEMQQYGRNAVPLNLVLQPCAPDEPTVLPVLLTKGIVLEALDEAGASTRSCDTSAMVAAVD